MNLTEHFSVDELTVTNIKKYKEENRKYGLHKITQLNILAHFCEQIRLIVGCPMIITSGIRCEALNNAVGSNNTSQHLKGEAVDFITKKIKIKTAFDKIRNSNLEFGQLIYEKTNRSEWVHISLGYKRQVLKYENNKYTTIV